MKCIHCGTHAKLRERKDGRCPRCRHPFAFEPQTELHGFTDEQFKKAIDRVSGDGKVCFTQRHLWYEVHRAWRSFRVVRDTYTVFPPAILGSLPGFALAYVLSAPALLWAAAGGAVAMVGAEVFGTWRKNRREPPPVGPPRRPFEAFQQPLARWVEVHGPIPGLLPPREEAAAAMPKEVPAGVAAFSFDRAVVTDRWETAQTLMANRFHFEHNCAVLSRDGYPDGIVAAGPGGSGGGGDTHYDSGVVWLGALGGGADTAPVDGFG